MPLFQPKVINDYLQKLDDKDIKAAFEVLKKKFSISIQKRIATASETSLQGEFVEFLFDNVLNYTRFPNDDWNIKREQDSENSNQRADAAIARDSDETKVIAVVELKSAKTHDLQQIEEQAFKYFSQHSLCRYAITSNFQHIRLYVDDKENKEQFDLYDLVKDEKGKEKEKYELFKKLYLYLNKDFVLNNLPVKLREATIQYEKKITDRLYSDYKGFRVSLHENLQKSNRKADKFLLFKKTQKLIDRFLFIFFAEDKGLLPALTVQTCINNWEKHKKGTLLDAFKLLFNELHKGNDAKGFFAYSGGLFEPDTVLDSLTLDIGNTLEVYLPILQGYDFKTEIDVNILGHIFEHSLNDMDEMKALSEGKNLEKSSTKRKKEGVFYTPQYITRYIVDNTIGALCREKERELGIIEGKIVNKEQLNAYRNWLFSLTVIDPACGSGAFLNAALDFFIRQHERIDERMAGVNNSPIEYLDYSNKILKNNIFGVDLNEEAVEIAKLSLWLRTATQKQKLTNLNDNIKVGNSLISDPSVSDAAFDWKKEFKNVFKNGGFDVVIGNPPYGVAFNEVEKNYIPQKYKSYKYKYESYIYFTELSLNIVKSKGFVGFITPELWLNLENCQPIREIISKEAGLLEINLVGENVFPDAVVNAVVFFMQKDLQCKDLKVVEKNEEWAIPSSNWLGNPTKSIEYRSRVEVYAILEKIEKNSKPLKNYGEVIQGITPYDKYRGQDPELIKRRGYHFTFKKDSTCGKWLDGQDINRYQQTWSGEWLSYGEWLGAPRTPKFFEDKRLLFREIPGKNKRIQATFADETYYYGHSITPFILNKDSKVSLLYVLAIANSTLISWYGKFKLPNFGKDIFPKLNPNDIKLLPIIESKNQDKIAQKASLILSENKKLNELRNKYLSVAYARFASLSTKRSLETWYEGDWKAFDGELKKQKCVLLPKEQTEWQTRFEQERRKIQAIQAIIQETDAAIDALVYGLYSLTKEEIRIVEQS